MGVSNNDWSGRGGAPARCAVLVAVQRERACSCQTTEQLSGTLVGFLGERHSEQLPLRLRFRSSYQLGGWTVDWMHLIMGLFHLWAKPNFLVHLSVLCFPSLPWQRHWAESKVPQQIHTGAPTYPANLSEMSHRHMLSDLFMRQRKPSKCK